MDFYGLNLFTIQGKSGGPIDKLLFFTAEHTRSLEATLYGVRKGKILGWDPKAKDKWVKTIVQTARNSNSGTIDRVGYLAKDPIQRTVRAGVSDIVPKRGKASAEIFIGKKGDQGFRARVAIPKVIAVEMYFEGDPDILDETSFLGEIAFVRYLKDDFQPYSDLVKAVLNIN